MRRLWLALPLAAVAILRLYSVAIAHVTLVSSEPAAGSRLSTSPTRLRLEFSEPVDPHIGHVTIVAANGHSMPLDLSNDPHNAYVLTAPVMAMGDGAFRVSWHVVSADGHPVSGSFIYTVGSSAAVVSLPPPVAEDSGVTAWGPIVAGAPAIPAVLRGLGVGSLAALAGLLFYITTFGAGIDSRPGRVALWLSLAAIVMLGAHLTTWLVNASPDHRLSGAWLSSAFASMAGRIELWRTLLALLPLWALALVRRPSFALLLTIPPLLLSSAIGHSAAFRPVVSIPLKALHLAALAAWLGGLLWLVTAERANGRRLSQEAGRVSSVALAGIIAMALSGVGQTFVLLPSWSSLRSPYGTIVLLKIVGIAVLAAFGAHHRFRVMPRLAADELSPIANGFAASLRREITLFWVVIVLGGFLAYTPPPAAVEHTTHTHSSESTP